MKKINQIIYFILTLIPINFVSAFGFGDASEKMADLNKNGVGIPSDLPSMITSVTMAVFSIVGTVFFVLMIYGGLVWLKSAGRGSEVERAKKIIMMTVVGFVIVMASYAISQFILSKI